VSHITKRALSALSFEALKALRIVHFTLHRDISGMTDSERQELPPTHSEVVVMTLLSELEPALAVALNSLGERMTQKVEDLYYLYESKHIHTAVDGFILLRREDRIDGARLLVRPALEAMLRLRSVLAKPHLIYRVLVAQAVETDKWLGGVAERLGEPYKRVRDSDVWQAVKARCASQFGAEKLVETPLSSYDAAATIGVESYYESHYRGYCQYTHGALEAVSGNLDEVIDPQDTRVMVHSAMTALEALGGIGASCPQLEAFCERFVALSSQKPQRLVRQKPR
jgi:hypothetical protein